MLGWGEAEKREIMALFLERLSVTCFWEVHVDAGLERLSLRRPWEVHVDTGLKGHWVVDLTMGQEDWNERYGSHWDPGNK